MLTLVRSFDALQSVSCSVVLDEIKEFNYSFFSLIPSGLYEMLSQLDRINEEVLCSILHTAAKVSLNGREVYYAKQAKS